MGKMNEFESKFGFGEQSDISTGASSSSGLCLSSVANFDEVGLADIYKDKSIGTPSELGELEFKYTHYASVNLPMVINTDMAYLIFDSLFQGGINSSGTSYWFYPYSYDMANPEVNDYVSIIKYLKDESKRMIGAVNKTVRLSFDNNNFMSAINTFHGREVESQYSIDGEDEFATSNKSLLTWNECNAKIGDGHSQLHDFTFSNIYVTVDNGLSARHYNKKKVERFILGDVMGSGNIEVPFDTYGTLSIETIIGFFDSSDPVRIVLSWGEGSTKLKIALLVKNITIHSHEDDEEFIRFNFNLVENMSLSTYFGGWSVSDINNNLISIDTSGNTLVDNIFPGDKFVYQREMYNIIDIPDSSTIKLESMGGLTASSSGSDYLLLRHPINVNVNLK